MKQFFANLRGVLGIRALRLVVLRTRENDLLGLAGQLAYFFLLSFFPFLIFLVALAGLVLNEPESAVRSLIGDAAGFLPPEAADLLVAYIDRTLRGTTTGVLLSGILATLWLGSAASISISKAANRAYGLQETRPFWKVRGTALLMALGFTVLIAALTLVMFEVEAYVRDRADCRTIYRTSGEFCGGRWPSSSLPSPSTFSTTWRPTPGCLSGGSHPADYRPRRSCLL